MGLMLVLIVFFIMIALVIGIITLFAHWIQGRVDYENTIKLKDLKKYYNEDPNPWMLDSDSVCYIKKNGRYSYQVNTQRFSFSLIDYIGYLWWKLWIEVDKTKKENESILAQIEQDYKDKEK
jgi:hypothetical protein